MSRCKFAWLWRLTRLWLIATVGLLASLAFGWLILGKLLGLQLLDVQTASMAPTFHPADVLVIKHTSAAPKVGEVVSYQSSRNPKELVTHRLIRVEHGSFQTKGDALRQPDPTVRNTLLVGKLVMVAPDLGHVLRWLRSLPGLIMLVYVPLLIIAMAELRRLEACYRSPGLQVTSK